MIILYYKETIGVLILYNYRFLNFFFNIITFTVSYHAYFYLLIYYYYCNVEAGRIVEKCSIEYFYGVAMCRACYTNPKEDWYSIHSIQYGTYRDSI